jgi:hypothetical protein
MDKIKHFENYIDSLKEFNDTETWKHKKENSSNDSSNNKQDFDDNSPPDSKKIKKVCIARVF